MALQTVDIVHALDAGGLPVTDLKVDGGAARNDLLCQFLADMTNLQIRRPTQLERTALGVALMAGSGVGLWNGPADVERTWTLDRVFDPQLHADRREELHAGWRDAVRRTLSGPVTAGQADPSPSQPGRSDSLLATAAKGLTRP